MGETTLKLIHDDMKEGFKDINLKIEGCNSQITALDKKVDVHIAVNGAKEEVKQEKRKEIKDSRNWWMVTWRTLFVGVVITGIGWAWVWIIVPAIVASSKGVVP